MNVKLSHEENIINALNRLPKKSINREWAKAQFDAIRAILQPLYDKIERLEDEQKLSTGRKIAIQYAGFLKEKLYEFRDSTPAEEKTSVHHLIRMCDQIVEHAGYVPNEWSVTKLHRWIGYIQGVMVSRGFTTVEKEREEYKQLKVNILAEMKGS